MRNKLTVINLRPVPLRVPLASRRHDAGRPRCIADAAQRWRGPLEAAAGSGAVLYSAGDADGRAVRAVTVSSRGAAWRYGLGTRGDGNVYRHRSAPVATIEPRRSPRAENGGTATRHGEVLRMSHDKKVSR